MACRVCGEPAKQRCYKCAAEICHADTRFYVDEANIAITRNAPPECSMCFPPKFPRPYTWARAIAQDEADWFPPGREPLVPRPQ
jgi:hypothetical protein